MHASLHYFLEKCPVYEKKIGFGEERKYIWNLNPEIEKGFSRLLSYWTSLYAKAFFAKGSITQGHLLLI